MKITLPPESFTSFVVVDPDGLPVAGALVEPRNFRARPAFMLVPEPIVERVSKKTDEQGRVKFPAMPMIGFSKVSVNTDEYGIQEVRLDGRKGFPAERTLQLRAISSVKGRIVADNPDWVRGIRLHVQTFSTGSMGIDAVTTDHDGRFVIARIASGNLRIHETLDPDLPVRLRMPDAKLLVAEPGKTTDLRLKLEPGIEVRGVVRVAKTLQPVAGATISIRHGGAFQHERLTSDEQGRIQGRIFPGEASLADHFNSFGSQRSTTEYIPLPPQCSGRHYRTRTRANRTCCCQNAEWAARE